MLKESAAKDQYCNLLSDFQLTQLVDSPSRVTEYSSSLVDHVWCSPSVCVSSVAQATRLSDHHAQIADFAITVQCSPTAYRWVRSFVHVSGIYVVNYIKKNFNVFLGPQWKFLRVLKMCGLFQYCNFYLFG